VQKTLKKPLFRWEIEKTLKTTFLASTYVDILKRCSPEGNI